MILVLYILMTKIKLLKLIIIFHILIIIIKNIILLILLLFRKKYKNETYEYSYIRDLKNILNSETNQQN